MAKYLENHIFKEIKIGDSASISKTFTKKDINLFAIVSGDVNPAHLDVEYAKTDMFHKIIAHGMLGASLISTVLGTKLPGPGTIYLEQTLKFEHPVAIGDVIKASVTIIHKNSENNVVELDCKCENQDGKIVISGRAKVIAPVEKVLRKCIQLPEVKFIKKTWSKRFFSYLSHFFKID